MRDECKCLLAESARHCVESQQCETCGFNPDVATKRKTAIRGQRKPEPPKPAQPVNFNDVLTAIDKRIEYAQERRDEQIRNGETLDIAYWRGRVDEARGIRAALEKTGGNSDV